MDYKKRQGRTKLKVSLPELRRMGIFEEIETPDVVYHMTDEENLQDILSDGKIKSFNDFMTYFFLDTKFVPIYIRTSGALIGRMYHSTDGKILTAPPLDVEHTVVLKLIPRHEEKLEWYRELAPSGGQLFGEIPEQAKAILDLFNQSRIAHYGNFAFRTDSVEVIKLKDIYDNIPKDVQEVLDWLDA